MGWLSGIVDGVRTWWSGRRSGETPDTLGPDFATVEELIERMRSIDRELGPQDGVRAFNHMYLRVTELVRDRVTDGYVTNPAFLARLDLRFAGLYLGELRAPVPAAAWAPTRAPARSAGLYDANCPA